MTTISMKCYITIVLRLEDLLCYSLTPALSECLLRLIFVIDSDYSLIHRNVFR